jgi:formylmethanofuran dehydrogenase subunit B
LTALKKAYAEIILNTAKEAAARIMVSEKRALRFEQELVSTKEEALRMLLRLKQMLDSKV